MFNLFNFKQIRYAARSPSWNKIRKKFLLENNKCAACGRSKDLEVHHIVPVHINPDLELDLDNLITLCANSCHILFGHLMDFKSYNPNVITDCDILSKKIKTRPYGYN